MLKKIFTFDYHHTLITDVARSAKLAAIAQNIILVILISYILQGIVSNLYLIIWATLNLISLVARIGISSYYIKKHAGNKEKDRKFVKIYLSIISTNAILHICMVYLASISGATPIEMIMILFPIVAIVAGSIGTLSHVFLLFFAYVSLNTFLLMTIAINYGGEMFNILAFMLAIFYILYLISGYKYHLVLVNNISLSDTFITLYNRSPNGIVLIKNNRFVDCNNSILKMFEYPTKEKFLHTHINKLSPYHQPDGIVSAKKMLLMTKLTTQNHVHSFEWVHTDSSGRKFWCDATLTKIHLNGEEHLYGVWQDISHRKVLELKQKELLMEIEEVNDSLVKKVKLAVEENRKKDKQLLDQSRFVQMGEMISMIAHQWRQPLSAITSRTMAIELSIKLDNLNKDNLLSQCSYINTYSQHLSSTIDDFRNFFKKDKLETKFTYDEVVSSVLKIMDASILNKSIKIDIHSNSTVVFKTFKNELKQVIINIIKNAEDALVDNKIKDATISILSNNTKLIIKDNAGGIDEEIIHKIFDPYFSTKLEKNGTGLGLYMSKTIVEDHCGGVLSVKNGKYGAVFKIELEAKEQEEEK